MRAWICALVALGFWVGLGVPANAGPVKLDPVEPAPVENGIPEPDFDTSRDDASVVGTGTAASDAGDPALDPFFGGPDDDRLGGTDFEAFFDERAIRAMRAGRRGPTPAMAPLQVILVPTPPAGWIGLALLAGMVTLLGLRRQRR